MYVIVNADDLGLHPAVRRAVRLLSSEGVLTSATLLANGPDLEASARLQGVGLGVHLNILRGRPVGPEGETSTVVDERGFFLGDYTALLLRYLSGRMDHGQVEREWTRQVERVLDLGVRPTHLDSEKHIHAWPTLMAVAGRVARRFGIGWVRRPLECGDLFRLDAGGLRTKFLHACSLFQRKPDQVRWPDRVFGVADQGENLRPELFARSVAKARPEVVEIVCHPGLPETGDPPLPPEFGPMRVAVQWAAETRSLLDPAWKETFAALRAHPTHYGNI